MKKWFLLIFILACMTVVVFGQHIEKVPELSGEGKKIINKIQDNKQAALEYVEKKILDKNLSYEETCYWATIHAMILERKWLAPIYIIENKREGKR